jgi:branched-chain amino acid transport system substrate-binding protein
MGKASEGVMGMGSWNPKMSKAAKSYFDAHVALNKKEPDRWASAHAWAALEILQQAVEKVGLDHKAIRDYIAKTEFDTVLGRMKFNGTEEVGIPGMVGQWQNGEFEIVWPPARATAKAVVPKQWN